jgi:hypothetical protein
LSQLLPYAEFLALLAGDERCAWLARCGCLRYTSKVVAVETASGTQIAR